MLTSSPVIFGPAATQWYKVLSKINFKSPIMTTTARVLADQTLFASANLALFLSSMAYLEGANVQKKLEESYLPALKMNWLVWPPVQAINFTFVPLQSQVLVVNVVALFWNCYLSYVNSGGGKSSVVDEAEQKLKEGKEKVQEKLS